MTATGDQSIELRLLSFNLWRGGVQVDFSRIVEAIRASGADVVGLQEPEGCTAALAETLGWPFADPARHILSRLPLFDPPNPNALYALVELRPGRFVAVANLHLNSDPSGPQAVQDGATADRVIALERDARLAQAAAYVEALKAAAGDGMPVFLLGDFNAPSHLDWTAATVLARPHLKFPLDWPVSRLIADAGLRDSYRDVHPDPATRPGITWTPGYPHPRLKPTELPDRIDFIYAGGPAEAIDSRLIGEPGGPEVEIAVSPWPSDHRAVLSTFRVRPAAGPAMVATHRKRIEHGASIAVRFHAPDGDADRVTLSALGDDAAADARMFMNVADDTDRRVVVFGTGGLAPGGYQVTLIGRSGQSLARTEIRLMGGEERVCLRALQAGRGVAVDWRGAPGNCFDWVAICRAGDADLRNVIAYRYTDARIDGDMTIALPPGLPAGRYEARLMLDDAHVVMASALFSLKE